MNVKEHIFLLLLQNVIHKWFKYSSMLMKLCCMQLACDSLMLQTETKEKVCSIQHRWLHAVWVFIVMTIEGESFTSKLDFSQYWICIMNINSPTSRLIKSLFINTFDFARISFNTVELLHIYVCWNAWCYLELLILLLICIEIKNLLKELFTELN